MKYTADDGKIFDTRKECLAYERSLKKAAKTTRPTEEVIADALSLSTYEDFLDALAGKNPTLAKHLEDAGRLCRNKRYELGDLKRKPKTSEPSAAEAPPAPPAPPSADADPLPVAAE